jgi:hypothetical protein
LHIGSQAFDFGAGLHSFDRGISEKNKSKRGHSVRCVGFMTEMKMVYATEMGLKKKSEGEERKPNTSTTRPHKDNDKFVGRSNSHSLGKQMNNNNNSWR